MEGNGIRKRIVKPKLSVTGLENRFVPSVSRSSCRALFHVTKHSSGIVRYRVRTPAGPGFLAVLPSITNASLKYATTTSS